MTEDQCEYCPFLFLCDEDTKRKRAKRGACSNGAV